MEGWSLDKVVPFAQGTTPMCKAGQTRGTFGDTEVTVKRNRAYNHFVTVHLPAHPHFTGEGVQA